MDFVSLMENCSVIEAARKMVEWFPEGKSETVAKPPATPATPNKPLAFQLKGISYHPYLKARQISEETAAHFGVGFFPGKGSMAGRIVIPIHDTEGQLLAYAGRAINGDEPKYKLPLHFQKSAVLYNLHRVNLLKQEERPKLETVTLVEGFFGCMRVVESGFPSVALMGASLSPDQEKLLRTFRFITLMLDPDEAGRKGTLDILQRLSKAHYVRVAQNPKSPDEMTTDEVQNCLRYSCPV